MTNVTSIPNTGGWQNWQTVKLTDISIAAGNSRLKLLFLTGGFNINYLSFILKSSSVNEGNLFEPVQEGFFLTQNYPNPFNYETKISYHLPEDCFVCIKIFNSSGQIVNTLANDLQNAGWHQVAWNNLVEEKSGRELSSGVYFCQIEASSKNNRYSDLKKMLYLK